MEPIIVPLRSRRQQRAVLAQKLQHAIPGVVLLTAGLQTLSEHPQGTELGVAIVEIAASVLLLGSMARTLHAKRHLFRSPSPSSSAAASEHAPHAHAAHAGIEWMDLFASAVLIAEGLERKMHGHHFPRPTMLAAATLAVLGLLHGRMQHFAEARRSIRVTADALFVPGRSRCGGFTRSGRTCSRSTWASVGR